VLVIKDTFLQYQEAAKKADKGIYGIARRIRAMRGERPAEK
jgi:hypothetical protein